MSFFPIIYRKSKKRNTLLNFYENYSNYSEILMLNKQKYSSFTVLRRCRQANVKSVQNVFTHFWTNKGYRTTKLYE